jgi:hypothetical protein
VLRLAEPLERLVAPLERVWSGTEDRLDHLRSAAADPLHGAWAQLRTRLRRHGAIVVSNVRVASDAMLLALALGMGTPDASGNGGRLLYEVRPRPLAAQGDVSTTRAPFALHTDSTALVNPHSTILLGCVAASAGCGGETRVVTLGELRAALEPSIAARLAEPIFPFALNDPRHGRGVRRAAVLADDGIRYRRDALAAGERAAGEPLPAGAREALDALDASSRTSALSLRTRSIPARCCSSTIAARCTVARRSPTAQRATCGGSRPTQPHDELRCHRRRHRSVEHARGPAVATGTVARRA